MNNYETPSSRARALYVIPTAPPPGRALEVCCGREPLFSSKTWYGQSCQSYSVEFTARHDRVSSPSPYEMKALPFGPEQFDQIVLHKTLDDLVLASRTSQARFDATAFMQQIGTILTPGGIVAGSIGNCSSPKRFLARLTRGNRSRDDSAYFSIRSCRRLLANAGFSEVRVFSLLPNWQSPLRLVEVEPTIARVAFRNELEHRRLQLSGFRFWVRKLVVEAGLYPHLEESIFFWARRPT